MSPEVFLLFLTVGVFCVAVLYSSVGHAGASGYIAVMSLLGLAPAVIRPGALALNVLVATIATWQFARAGHFSWRLYWPFALPAVPLAFVGGALSLPVRVFQIVVGFVLLYSALRFIVPVAPDETPAARPPSLPVALLCGGVIGLMSGLTGTGGGIFLTPLLLMAGWAQPKMAAGVSAPFILANSVAGLLGNYAATQALPSFIAPVLLAAAAGGLIGAWSGSRRFSAALIRRLLAAVLGVAGLKLFFA